jgi:DNA repair protein RadC
VFHNHPSGDPTPSQNDRQITQRLMEAGEVMGIQVMDHIILGEGRYFSFWEEARR